MPSWHVSTCRSGPGLRSSEAVVNDVSRRVRVRRVRLALLLRGPRTLLPLRRLLVQLSTRSRAVIGLVGLDSQSDCHRVGVQLLVLGRRW